MKKILFCLVLLSFVMPFAKAQSVGDKWVGGSIGFTTSKEDDKLRTYDYNIVPEFGYILSDRFALGIALGYDHAEYVSSYHSAENAFSDYVDYVVDKNGFVVNPFVRYTILKGSIGGLFVDGGINYKYYKIQYHNNHEDSSEYEMGFRPGVAVVLSSRLSLIGRFGFLGYSSSRYETDVTSGFNINMKNVSLGINVVF